MTKPQTVFVGLLAILAGVLPFLEKLNIKIVPAFLTTGVTYQLIVIAVGLMAIIFCILSKMWMGPSKIMTIFIGILIILGGLIPLLQIQFKMLTMLPTQSLIYTGIIIVLGVIAVGYGARQMTQ